MCLILCILFRVAELQGLMSSRSFLGELQEFWGALYGFAEQGCKWFSCVGFKDKQLLSVDWDAKPVSKFASAKGKEKEMNKPTIHTSFSPTFYRISFLNSKCMKKWQQSTGYCPQCWHRGQKPFQLLLFPTLHQPLFDHRVSFLVVSHLGPNSPERAASAEAQTWLSIPSF